MEFTRDYDVVCRLTGLLIAAAKSELSDTVGTLCSSDPSATPSYLCGSLKNDWTGDGQNLMVGLSSRWQWPCSHCQSRRSSMRERHQMVLSRISGHPSRLSPLPQSSFCLQLIIAVESFEATCAEVHRHPPLLILHVRFCHACTRMDPARCSQLHEDDTQFRRLAHATYALISCDGAYFPPV